ncbi:flavin monoamine oxidase family protein [Pseudomonas aegrilactucae]|uniref:Tryptophan 2-monooxygenase n=1 Tax=Pseudomonas aegrilactucae TaxID=2854028 RepID=A0A9Q3ADI9_9PSED|nr:FAD-dependent oxidoreductase [Pseudomonas aegrilactucae]MBV6287745.1 FAD-dependent oxidoreductase [Pseudomonas aegrilactucae]
MGLTRRDVITRLAAIGGYSAAVGGLPALTLPGQNAQAATFTPLNLASRSGNGKRVLIVGGGISGLVSAYELRKAGFEVKVLEARERIGGRVWTLRNGDRIEHDNASAQTVAFDDGLFFNAGAARLPSHHLTILGYCRELGVELEVLVNSSRNALAQPDLSQPPLLLRQAVNDTRGHLSELLARSVNRHSLDQELSGDERKALLDFLKVYGDLNEQQQYRGSVRSGYTRFAGAGDQTPINRSPVELKRLLDSNLLLPLVFDEIPEFSSTMFQPKGGMDQIPKAFYRQVKDAVQLNAEVLSLRTSDNASQVVWRDRKTGRQHTESADYAVVALPLPLLQRLDTNFTVDFKQALGKAKGDTANKVAWQSPRFWETDFQIYGGLSYINHEARTLWYPSDRLNSAQGVLVATYNTGEVAQGFAAKSHTAQFASSRAAVESLHPGHAHKLGRPLAINWGHVPFSESPWIVHDEVAQPAYDTLNQPQGRTWLASDALAHGGVGIWQNSAAESARRVVGLITRHATQTTRGVAA